MNRRSPLSFMFTSTELEGTHIYRYETELRKATQEELEAEYQAIKSKEV